MTDKKITQLTALTGANAVAGDQLAIVDVSDTTMSASGTTKKIALSELQAAPLSAGTANGVAYLNGSKVLTTGSALTFDGTSLFVQSGGTNAKLDAFNAAQKYLDFTWYGASIGSISQVNGTYISINSSALLPFSISGSEQMRLTSTGLGIGTSSPGVKLDVRTSLSATTGVQNIADFYPITSGSTDGTYGGRITLYTKNPNGNYWPAAIAAINDAGGSNLSSLGFYTAAGGATLVERARIDSSGNLGIGTTANASAILDAQSTTKGVRMPNMTTTQKNAIASPAAGLMVFDTTLAKLCVYTGAAWQTITSV